MMSLLLVLAAMIWGAAFVAQSVGTEYVGACTFVCTRYILSAAILLPLGLAEGRKKRKAPAGLPAGRRGEKAPLGRAAFVHCLKGGAVCGIFLALASLSQQLGIETTTVGKGGFITALYVVGVPLLGIFFGKRPPLKIWLCVALSVIGLYLISVKEGFVIEKGDALMILCAFVFSFQIMSVDHFSKGADNLFLLAGFQFLTTAVISGIGMLLFETPLWPDITAAGIPILYAGVMSGAIGYTLQMAGQKYTDPALASLIMSLEAVFSALTAWVLLQERMSGREVLGSVALFAAVILAQLPGRQKKPP
ncbi:MAG: DMT family transporter [Lachnospiraceae bacterium]|nr:DMT family transporter [Lachnospiraceae bacterium]